MKSGEGKAEIVFNVVELDQAKGRMYPRRGLATGWIEDISKNETAKMLVYGRSNKNFRHPEELSKNLIMIGPGTGVAPFRGFLQQRQNMIEANAANKNDGVSLGRTWLFFGCRNEKKDYIFRYN